MREVNVGTIEERLARTVRSVFQLGGGALDGVVYKEHPRWDSLGHIQLILALEKEFGVKFSSEEVVSMRRVEDLAAALRRKGGQSR
jgi:acyl carrier protein